MRRKDSEETLSQKNKKRIAAELERVRGRDRQGLLRPEDVVEAARRRSSPLHSHFTWDDTEAARQHRLAQARYLIRVTVTVLPGSNEPTRAYVSLSSEREPGKVGVVTGGNGYMATRDVLSKAALRSQMLEDALRELESFQRKYAQLSELAEVFSAAKKITTARAAKSATVAGKRLRNGRKTTRRAS